jgi:hypothetical protein
MTGSELFWFVYSIAALELNIPPTYWLSLVSLCTFDVLFTHFSCICRLDVTYSQCNSFLYIGVRIRIHHSYFYRAHNERACLQEKSMRRDKMPTHVQRQRIHHVNLSTCWGTTLLLCNSTDDQTKDHDWERWNRCCSYWYSSCRFIRATSNQHRLPSHSYDQK